MMYGQEKAAVDNRSFNAHGGPVNQKVCSAGLGKNPAPSPDPEIPMAISHLLGRIDSQSGLIESLYSRLNSVMQEGKPETGATGADQGFTVSCELTDRIGLAVRRLDGNNWALHQILQRLRV